METGSRADSAPDLLALAHRLVRPGERDRAAALLDDWRQLLELVSCRRARAPETPLLAILLGPTGVGKSTLLNSLLEQPVSSVGAIRPTTSRPVFVGSPALVEGAAADPYLVASNLDLVSRPVSASEAPLLADQVLVDTPDFDGIEAENRRRAQRLLLRADRAILIVSPEKYADESVWEVIRTLAPLENLSGCILNKAEGTEVRDDLESLLSQEGIAMPIVSVPRVPNAVDVLSFDPPLENELRELLSAPADRRAWTARLLAAAERREKEERRRHVEPIVLAVAGSIERLRKGLLELERDLDGTIERRLPLELDEALRRELVARFSRQVDRIDFLKAPRRWVSESWQWVRGKIPFAGSSAEKRAEIDATTSEWLYRAYRSRYEELVFELADEVRRRCRETAPKRETPFSWPSYATPESSAIEAGLRELVSDLEKEIIRESERIAEGLPWLSKLGFFGSQLAIHAVMLLLFVKTGGLTGGEVVVQGLSSPLLARVVGLLISGGEAAALERRLSQFYSQRARSILLPLLEPVSEALTSLEQSVPSAEVWAQATRRWDDAETRA